MSQASMEAARGFIQAYNGADWDRLEAMLTPDCLYDEVGSGQRAQGPREIAGVFKGWKHAMPDSDGTVTRAVDGGDTAVLEVTWNGRSPVRGPPRRVRSSRPASTRPLAPASSLRSRATRSRRRISTSTRCR